MEWIIRPQQHVVHFITDVHKAAKPVLRWRRTLYTLWVTQFIAVAGFSFVTPFVPYYIQELGVTDLGQVRATLTALLAKLTPKGREGVVFGLDASAMAASNAIGPLTGATAAAGFGMPRRSS